MDNLKIVDFMKWCHKCKDHDTPEVEDPCNECLAQGWNVDSTKPINWRENEKEE